MACQSSFIQIAARSFNQRFSQSCAHPSGSTRSAPPHTNGNPQEAPASEWKVRAVEPHASRNAPPRCATQTADLEPLLAPVLQSYRSTVSEATGFTPYRLAFGRKMRLPVYLGMPLPEPPRDLDTFSSELAEDLEWS